MKEVVMEAVIQKVRNLKFNGVVKSFGIFALFYVLSKAYIASSVLHPFAFAMFFALLYVSSNGYLLTLLYFCAVILAEFSLNGVYIALTALAVGILATFVFSRSKRRPKYLVYIFAFLSQLTTILLNSQVAKSLLASIFSVLLGLFFLFCCMSFINAMLNRQHNFVLNIDEKICASIVLCAVSIGLSCITGIGISLVIVFAVACILFCTYSFGSNCTLLVASIVGLGYAICTKSPLLISTFVCYGVVSIAFKTNYKILSIIAIMLIDIVFSLYFNGFANFNYLNLISIALGGVAFVLIPQKITEDIKDIFGNKKDKIAIRNIVNRSKEGICKRMLEISDVFADMDRVYRNMIKGVLSQKDAKELLAQELLNKVCSKCPERNKCMRVDGKFTTQVFDQLIDAGFERGKVTLLDVPPYLTGKCGSVNYIISNLNQLLRNYKQYTNMVHNMDASRMLIADQLGGVSTIIKELANEINLNISFDIGLESRIVEELTYKNIICYEAIVYEQNVSNKNITLLVRDNADGTIIENVVSKISNNKVKIVASENSQVPGLKVVNLKTAPNFDIVFGSASVGKEGVMQNGDTHSLIKLDNFRYMMALCDGMGTGKKAHDVSELSITLIENFYKAGFDNDVILNSVNKLLSINNEESYSALDLCVLDLKKNICDFIKLGAPFGFIKKSTGVEVIETSGLPIGILEEMKPHVTKKMLDPFDIIVLCTDGITDSFGSAEALKDFIFQSNTINPQTLAEDILDRAVDLNQGVLKDDMTVLAVRVFPL